MLKTARKFLKDYLYSPRCPEVLSQAYFKKKDESARKQLFEMIRSESDLMLGVPEKTKEHWESRIHNVLIAEDNPFIPRNSEAGKLKGEWLIMHNGLKIDPMSYYGFGLMKMLINNKGVHEPQEEKIFQEVLHTLDQKKPLVMMELGAYWSFYSMWLLTMFPKSQCFMVEPDKKNLYYGKKNFITNKLQGKFIHAGIGNQINKNQNVMTVDALCEKHEIPFLDILHSDIQGYELEMLQGSKRMLSEGKIGYTFISTHSNELHEGCRKHLLEYGFTEIASANVDESYSWDGILVMKAPEYSGLKHVTISKRKTA
jgi:hypothetical protein